MTYYVEVSVFRKKTQIGPFNKTNRFVFLERPFLSGLCNFSKHKSAGFDFVEWAVFFFETQIRWFRFRVAGEYSQNPRVCELNRFVFL